MTNFDINLPMGICNKENFLKLRELADKEDETQFRETIESYLEQMMAANPGRDVAAIKPTAMSYLGALCMIADRGYLTLGIPYPPAPLGEVEKRFLKIYDHENYERFKKVKWKRNFWL